jgi:hypothetical protein
VFLHEAVAIPTALNNYPFGRQSIGLLLEMECKGTLNRGDVPRKSRGILGGAFVSR